MASDDGDDNNNIRNTLGIVVSGFRSALRLDRSLKYIATLQTTSISTQQCFAFNGTIFLGSILMYSFFLIPLLTNVAKFMCKLDGKGGCTAKWDEVHDTVENISELLFKVLWLMPMYILSFILNAVFYFDMAKEVYSLEFGKPKSGELFDVIRDSLYNHLLMAWVSVGSWVVYFVPYIGPLISLLYTSWAVAFYAFDYKWTLDGWGLEKRLRYFQLHYIYMVGFGMPCALITMFLPQFLGYGVYCVVFPVCMIIAIISTPIQHKPSAMFPRSLRMFMLAEWVNLVLVRVLGLQQRSRRNKSTCATTKKS